TDARILVKGERIARVEPGPGSDLDAFSEVIDASGKTVMPGLIDSHKHLFNNGGPTVGIGLTPAQIFRNMKTSLWGGVTSCLDLGSPNTIKTHLKLTSKKPRVYYAITILTCPGGYPSEYMPKLHYKMGAAKEVGTDKEIKTTVRKLAEKGVSVIKTVTVTRTLDGGNLVGWTDHQLRTLCDEAHGWGLKVCSHITYVQDYAQAIRCGVDSVHHAAFDDIMKEEDLDAMVEKGMVFVPTLSLFDLFVAGFSEKWHERPDFDPPVNNPVKKAIKEFTEEWEKTPDDKAVDGTFIKIPKGEFAQAAQNQVRSLAKYVEKGGIVAMGTDSSLGFSFHSTPVRELELLHQCGMSPLEVIKASTLTSASVFDKEKEIGSIEPGKLADILIVNGDPLSDINTVGNTDTVILGGRVMVDGKK
ncbi:MAG: amidohydrolase family protein, partial [Proteobacteria bacterium]|nr:amidohydrolase family protein [Pseudomonadota bacterium]